MWNLLSGCAVIGVALILSGCQNATPRMAETATRPDPVTAEAPLILRGRVFHLEKILLPAPLTLALELVRSDSPDPTPVATLVLHDQPRTPIPYMLEIDRASLTSGARYALVAEIRASDGDVLAASSPATTVDLTTALDAIDIRVTVGARRASAPKRVRYDCGGRWLEIEVEGDTLRLHSDDRSVELLRTESASGERYEGKGAVFHSKADRAQVELDGEPWPECIHQDSSAGA